MPRSVAREASGVLLDGRVNSPIGSTCLVCDPLPTFQRESAKGLSKRTTAPFFNWHVPLFFILLDSTCSSRTSRLTSSQTRVLPVLFQRGRVDPLLKTLTDTPSRRRLSNMQRHDRRDGAPRRSSSVRSGRACGPHAGLPAQMRGPIARPPEQSLAAHCDVARRRPCAEKCQLPGGRRSGVVNSWPFSLASN